MEKNEKTCQSGNKGKMAKQIRDKASSPVRRQQARREQRMRTAKSRLGPHVAAKAALGTQQTRLILSILNLHPLRNLSRFSEKSMG